MQDTIFKLIDPLIWDLCALQLFVKVAAGLLNIVITCSYKAQFFFTLTQKETSPETYKELIEYERKRGRPSMEIECARRVATSVTQGETIQVVPCHLEQLADKVAKVDHDIIRVIGLSLYTWVQDFRHMPEVWSLGFLWQITSCFTIKLYC